MKTTILINDIKQDYRHTAFFSPSTAGLGYAPIQGRAGDTLAVTFDTPEEDREFLDALKQYEKYAREHWVELELNGRGLL